MNNYIIIKVLDCKYIWGVDKEVEITWYKMKRYTTDTKVVDEFSKHIKLYDIISYPQLEKMISDINDTYREKDIKEKYNILIARIKEKSLESILWDYRWTDINILLSSNWERECAWNYIDETKKFFLKKWLSLKKANSKMFFKYEDENGNFSVNYLIDDIFFSKDCDEIYLRVFEDWEQKYLFSNKDFNRVILMLDYKSIEI